MPAGTARAEERTASTPATEQERQERVHTLGMGGTAVDIVSVQGDLDVRVDHVR